MSDRQAADDALQGFDDFGQETPPAGMYPFNGSIRVISNMTGAPIQGAMVTLKNSRNGLTSDGPLPTDANGRRSVKYVYEKPENQPDSYHWEVVNRTESGVEIRNIAAIPGKEVVAGIDPALGLNNRMMAAAQDYLIAQAITLAVGIGGEMITQKSNSVAVWRLVFLGLAGSLGYTTYRAFDLAKKSGAADKMLGTVAGGAAGTIQGLLGLGMLAGAFGKIDPTQKGKQYTLVTKVKQMSQIVKTRAAV
jgi:hypothetical protein